MGTGLGGVGGEGQVRVGGELHGVEGEAEVGDDAVVEVLGAGAVQAVVVRGPPGAEGVAARGELADEVGQRGRRRPAGLGAQQGDRGVRRSVPVGWRYSSNYFPFLRMYATRVPAADMELELRGAPVGRIESYRFWESLDTVSILDSVLDAEQRGFDAVASGPSPGVARWASSAQGTPSGARQVSGTGTVPLPATS
jgi:hypothetical protein